MRLQEFDMKSGSYHASIDEALNRDNSYRTLNSRGPYNSRYSIPVYNIQTSAPNGESYYKLKEELENPQQRREHTLSRKERKEMSKRIYEEDDDESDTNDYEIDLKYDKDVKKYKNNARDDSRWIEQNLWQRVYKGKPLEKTERKYIYHQYNAYKALEKLEDEENSDDGSEDTQDDDSNDGWDDKYASDEDESETPSGEDENEQEDENSGYSSEDESIAPKRAKQENAKFSNPKDYLDFFRHIVDVDPIAERNRFIKNASPEEIFAVINAMNKLFLLYKNRQLNNRDRGIVEEHASEIVKIKQLRSPKNAKRFLKKLDTIFYRGVFPLVVQEYEKDEY